MSVLEMHVPFNEVFLTIMVSHPSFRYVKVGDTVTMGDAACEVQSDKVCTAVK